MTDVPFFPPHAHDGLLDPEALETPRRLSRDEHRAVAGPDWSWIQPDRYEESFDD